MVRSAVLPIIVLKQWLAPGMAIFWFLACQIYFRWPLIGGVIVLIALIAFPIVLRLVNPLWRQPWSTVIAVFIILVTAISAASFASSAMARHLLTTASAGLLFVLLQSPAANPLSVVQGRLTLLAMTVGYWFGWVSLLSINIFLNWSVWILAGLSVALTVAVAAVVWVDGGVPWSSVRRRIWLPAWLGLELWLTIWALPTSILVGSVVATTAIMLWLQVCRHVWLKTWHADRGWRYVVVGSAVVAIALLTARWI